MNALEKGGELDRFRVEVAAPDERVTSARLVKCLEVLHTPLHRQYSVGLRGRCVAIDEGNDLAALARAKTEVLERPVRLIMEAFDDLVLEDVHSTGKHVSRVMSVGVDSDRRYILVGEQILEPANDAAFLKFLPNAHTDLAKFTEAKDVQLMHLDGFDDVRGQSLFFGLPFLCADLGQGYI